MHYKGHISSSFPNGVSLTVEIVMARDGKHSFNEDAARVSCGTTLDCSSPPVLEPTIEENGPPCNVSPIWESCHTADDTRAAWVLQSLQQAGDLGWTRSPKLSHIPHVNSSVSSAGVQLGAIHGPACLRMRFKRFSQTTSKCTM